MARIAINGLGRIARAALKIALGVDGADAAAVNDLIPAGHIAYLLRYDTVCGRYGMPMAVRGDSLIMDGRAAGPGPRLPGCPGEARRGPGAGVNRSVPPRGGPEEAPSSGRPVRQLAGSGAGRDRRDRGARREPGPHRAADDLMRELHHQPHRAGRRGDEPANRRTPGDHDRRARPHPLPAADRRSGRGLPARPGRRQMVREVLSVLGVPVPELTGPRR